MNKTKLYISLMVFIRLIACLAIILADYAISDHNAEGVELLDTPYTSSITEFALNPFVKWDSIHFLSLALHGYRKDYQFVFYPLFPYYLSLFSGLTSYLFTLTEMEHLIWLGVISNMMWNCVSIILLKEILLLLNFEDSLIHNACMCFIFNPALIFFVDLYSESIFTVFTWSAMYLFLKFPESELYLIPAVLSCCCRSNGIFLIIPLSVMYCQTYLKSPNYGRLRLLMKMALLSCLLVPSLIFAYIGNHFMCDSEEIYSHHLSYCSSNNHYLSLKLYPYLQKLFWNVSFLSSYQFRQIPNILLAVPVVCVAIYALFCIKSRTKPLEILQRNCFRSSHRFSGQAIIYSKMFPWKIHLFVTLLVCLFWAHIQISTRVLCSSSPLLYVALGQLVYSKNVLERKLSRYFIVTYITLGVLLHSNFYPWT
jgi:phosphatidylinositol glycan class V